MLKNKFRVPRVILCGVLCAGMILSPVSLIYASSETQTESTANPTPTPDPHTAAYYTPADTNSIEGWPAGPAIEATAAVLMDVQTGTILYSKNADTVLYPASITKIMTLLLGSENLNPKDPLIMSQSAAFGIEVGSSSIWADTNEEFTIEQAMMAVALESANEMSLAIAEEVSGSSKKFVELMNERAANLGCTNTHFNNPNGLPDETHYTTAGDMAKIAAAAWQNLTYRSYVTEDYYEIPPTNRQPETRYMLNHHKMMAGRDYAYEGVLGGKTGYTVVAGNTLITYAKRDSTTLVSVVMQSVGGAYADTAALLDYGFNNFKKVKVTDHLTSVTSELLPSEKYIMNRIENIEPFTALRNGYANIPVDADEDSITIEKSLLSNEPGAYRLESLFYYNSHPVGWGMEVEEHILPELLS